MNKTIHHINGHTFFHLYDSMGTPYDRGTDYWRCKTCGATYSGSSRGWDVKPQGRIYPCMNPAKEDTNKKDEV